MKYLIVETWLLFLNVYSYEYVRFLYNFLHSTKLDAINNDQKVYCNKMYKNCLICRVV
jgi:hypothetical protein